MAAGKVLPALRRHSTFSESESAFEWKSKETKSRGIRVVRKKGEALKETVAQAIFVGSLCDGDRCCNCQLIDGLWSRSLGASFAR
ncbi:hypothetical protein AOLI_G00053810 [Acnodon oligacanthus]